MVRSPLFRLHSATGRSAKAQTAKLQSPELLVSPGSSILEKTSPIETLPVEILDMIVDNFESENLENPDKALHATLGSIRLSCRTLANLRSTLRLYFSCVKIPATTATRSKIETSDMSIVLKHARYVKLVIPQLGPRNECFTDIIDNCLPKDFLQTLKSICSKFTPEIHAMSVLDSYQAEGMLASVGPLVEEGENLLISSIFPFTLKFTQLQKLVLTTALYPELHTSTGKGSIKIVKSAAELARYRHEQFPNELKRQSQVFNLFRRYFQNLARTMVDDAPCSDLQTVERLSNLRLSTSSGTQGSARTTTPKLFLLSMEPRVVRLAVKWYDKVGVLSITSAYRPMLPIAPTKSFTMLKELSVTQSTISAPVFAQFLHRCSMLESLFCAGCEIEDNQANWRIVFGAIRDHQNRMTVKIDTVKSKRTGRNVRIDVVQHTGEPVEHFDYYESDHKLRKHHLVEYLTGNGDWSPVLEDWFNI